MLPNAFVLIPQKLVLFSIELIAIYITCNNEQLKLTS